MKNFKYLILAILFFGCAGRSMHNIEMYEGYENNPALLLHAVSKVNGVYSATGFAVSRNTVLTVAHFCSYVFEIRRFEGEAEIKLSVQKEDGQYKTQIAKVVAIDMVRDICLLRAPNHEAKLVELSEDNDLQPNDDVWMIGMPLGLSATHSYGKVVATEYAPPIPEFSLKTMSINKKLITTVPAVRGTSGAPLFNEDGEVVGMCIMRLKGPYDHYSVFTTLKDIYQFLYNIKQ